LGFFFLFFFSPATEREEAGELLTVNVY